MWSSVRLVVALGLAGACLSAPSTAWAASGVWVEVSPGSVRPGHDVTIRADCEEGSPTTATVTSPPLGTLALEPMTRLLSATVQVDPDARAGTYDVNLTCRTGATASTTLTIVAPKPTKSASRGPNTGGGFLAGRDGDDRAEQSWPRRLNHPATWLAGAVVLAVLALLAGLAITRRRLPRS